MRATSTDALPLDDEAWAYEVKWDGYRMLAFVEGGRVRLQTRNLLDATADFPELQGLGDALAPLDAVLDGEVVAFDDTGRPSFGALQRRHERPVAVHYVIFDLLELAGRPTIELPYVERRGLLDRLELRHGRSWDVPPARHGGGAALFEATQVQGLEGVVAKRLDSRYEPGRRADSWRKLKHLRRQELVIGGWLPGAGARQGAVGSLLVGHHDAGVPGVLRYAGRVGTGFTDAELRRLGTMLATRSSPTCPFAEPAGLPVEVRRRGRWVTPDLVAEVAFAEWTHTGTIRHPSYKGLRTDIDPREVLRDP